MSIQQKIRSDRWRNFFYLLLAISLAIVFSLLSISVNFIQNIYEFFKDYPGFPYFDFLISLVFILLLWLLLLTFRLWRNSSKKLNELENIIDSISPDVLLIVDAERTILMANKSIKRMFGFDAENIKGLKTDTLYFDRRTDTAQKHEIYYILEREGFHIGIATGKKKDGELFPLEIITGNLSGREGAVLLLRDITQRKLSEENLSRSEAKHRLLLNSIKSAIIALDGNMSILYCNESFSKIVGIPIGELEWKKLLAVFPEIRRTRFYDAFVESNVSGKTVEIQDTFKGRVLSGKIQPMPLGVLAVLDDITEKLKAEKALFETESRFKNLFESSPDAVYVTDVSGNIIDTNPTACKLHDLNRDEIVGKNIEDFVPDFWKANFARDFERIKSDSTNHIEGFIQNSKSITIPVEIKSGKLDYLEGKVLLLHLRDITQRKLLEDELRVLASTDSLTGAKNRGASLHLLERQLSYAKANSERVTICYVDVNGLKKVNDTYGHIEGDEVLRTTVKIFNDVIRDTDIVARWGGDEFLLVLPNCRLDVALKIWERISSRLDDYNFKAEKPYKIELSCGFAEYSPETDLKIDSLIALADNEMYKNKKEWSRGELI